MSDKKPLLQRIATPLLGGLVALNLILSLFVYTQMTHKSRVGYIDMRKVLNTLVADLQEKTQEILGPKIQALNQKGEILKKKKEEFERKKARGKSTENAKTTEKIEALEKELQDEWKALNEDFYNRLNEDFNKKIKDITEGVEYVRSQNKCDIIFHESIALCLERVDPQRITTMSSDDTLDLTSLLLAKLGLEEKAANAPK